MRTGPSGASTVHAASHAVEDLNTEAESAKTQHSRTMAEIVWDRTENHGDAIHTPVKVKCPVNIKNLTWYHVLSTCTQYFLWI